jgi:glycosyltransferase involved in cell wall biosynthesis
MRHLNESVSVIVPAFNRASCIGEALESLQRQTHGNWNAIVVDDCSTDATVAVVQEYCRQDKRISLLAQGRNQGAQAARNAGIRAATSKWIAFLDSDDQYVPDSLEIRLRKACETGFRVIHSSCGFLNTSDHSAKVFEVRPSEGNIYKDVLQRPGPLFPSLLVAKDALAHIDYLDESIISYQEWDTAIRLAKHYHFGFVAEPTFLYRLSGEDSISRDLSRTAAGYEQVVRKHFRAILFQAGPHAVANHYSSLAYLYRLAGKNTKAVSSAINAVAWWPLKLTKIMRGLRTARAEAGR